MVPFTGCNSTEPEPDATASGIRTPSREEANAGISLSVPFAQGRETDYLGDEELERILQRHRVDLHLSGHHHAYYPAAKDGVRFVSQACLGAAPRNLLGSGRRSERAITVIEFRPDEPISVEAYRAPAYTERIHRHDLPDPVVSKRATLVRDDLAPAGRGAESR